MAGLAIASGVMNLLGSVISSGTSIANTVLNKDAYAANARANEVNAQTNLEIAKRNSRIFVIIIAAVAVIVVIYSLRRS